MTDDERRAVTVALGLARSMILSGEQMTVQAEGVFDLAFAAIHPADGERVDPSKQEEGTPKIAHSQTEHRISQQTQRFQALFGSRRCERVRTEPSLGAKILAGRRRNTEQLCSVEAI